MSKITGNPGKQANVMFANVDATVPDKKFEGYSNLKGDFDKQTKRAQKGAASDEMTDLEDKYRLNLQQQIYVLEHQIKQLKEREVDQKNKASGYETLLRDGIPLNEHFLALKNKFNNEQDMLTKNANMVDEELRKEEQANMQKNRKIENLKREYEELSTQFQEEKEYTLKQKRELEMKLYTELHTRDILSIEKNIQNGKIGTLKSENQNMQRAITKDKYHNNREDQAKEKKRTMDEINDNIASLSEKCEFE